ncbi:MAG: hypothetical protein RL417_139 [Pseudomonadota bacterium]|jgi:hypothetical protein
MLLVYSRNESIAGALSAPGTAALREPSLSERGDMAWSLEGGLLSNLTEVVPSISDIGSIDLRSRFVVRGVSHDGRVGEVRLDWIGGETLRPEAIGDPGPLKIEIDTVVVTEPLRSCELRLEFGGGVRPSRDALITLSLRGPRGQAYPDLALLEGTLKVPPFSQFEQSSTIGPRICSPTSVAMILNYYGFAVSPVEIAERSYAEAHDLYGVWPRNIWAASLHGVAGCLMHIESWSTVDYFLRRDIPIAASIRYRRSDLNDAAFYRPNDELTSHLVVVTGHGGGKIFVNDPAAQGVGKVPCAYDRREFERVWFGGSGIGYILLPPLSRR